MSGGAHIHCIAAEPSGDKLGAALITALRIAAAEHGLTPPSLSGLGGPLMAAEGVQSPFDISELSIVGYVEGLLAYPRILQRVEQAVEHALAQKPDAVVLIDSWGFMIRVAERLRQRAPDLIQIKYIAPQVWASRPKRARNLARAVDHVLTLLPFEPPYFEKYGAAAECVGHPVFDDVPMGDAAAFRARHTIAPERKVLALLYGSRRKEVERLAEPFAAAIAALEQRLGYGLAVVAPLAEAVADQVRALLQDDARLSRVIAAPPEEKWDAFAAADAALACSGTVVTELALADTPTVAAYRLDPISYAIAKRLVTAPHISLVNMALDAPVDDRATPEFVQQEATGAALAEAVSAFLSDEDLAMRTRARLRDAVARLRGDGAPASRRAADAIGRILAARGVMGAADNPVPAFADASA